MSDAVIQAARLSKSFRTGSRETAVLHSVDLAVERGEYVAIMGPSGCGKSTLMHILGLMLAPSEGRVWIDGVEATELKTAQRARIRREKIGFVFQRFNLLPTVSAAQNIALAQRIRRHSTNGQVAKSVADVLEAVGLSGRADHKPGQLSIGEQQRVAIARGIVHRPAILLADEPTGSLDSANTGRILELFERIHREQGQTMVVVTHSEEVAAAAKRVIRVRDGRVVDA